MTEGKDQEVIKSMEKIMELSWAAFMGAVASKLLEPFWIVPFPFKIMAGVLVTLVVLLYAIVFVLLKVMVSELGEKLIRKSKKGS